MVKNNYSSGRNDDTAHRPFLHFANRHPRPAAACSVLCGGATPNAIKRSSLQKPNDERTNKLGSRATAQDPPNWGA